MEEDTEKFITERLHELARNSAVDALNDALKQVAELMTNVDKNKTVGPESDYADYYEYGYLGALLDAERKIKARIQDMKNFTFKFKEEENNG